MKPWVFDPEAVNLQGALTLAVVRRQGRKLVGHRVEVDAEVEQTLRGVCASTVARIRGLDPQPFGPDVRIEVGETYLAVPGIPLLPAPPKQPSTADAANGNAEPEKIETDIELPEILARASSLDLLSARDLPRGFLLYAVVLGDEPTDRHAFVRKANPRSAVRPGKIITFFGDRLARLTEPLLVLDEHFDLVMGGGGVAVLSQSAFEQLFRDTEALVRRFPLYVRRLSRALPIGEDAARRLTEFCVQRPRLGRKLRAVYENGLLKPGAFKIEALKKEARRQGLEPSELIRRSHVVIENVDQAGNLLKLLNEDLMTGAFSKVRYEVGSKLRRP